jgi:uncharacterized protein
MLPTSRRDFLYIGLGAIALPVAVSNLSCSPDKGDEGPDSRELSNEQAKSHLKDAGKETAMKIQYLEIVTPDVAAACLLYSQVCGVTFGSAVQELGGARTASLASGGMIGIRAPLRDTEKPVVRPYVLVKNIDAAVATAAKAGALIAVEPTEIAGRGQFAIFIHGGIESGLWQL